MSTLPTLALVCALGAPAWSQTPAESPLEGYVVKVEGKSAYLDKGQGTAASVGRRFFVYTQGEELKHPVTGASLGPVVNKIASGAVIDVQEKYCLGVLESGEDKVQPGQRFRLADELPPTQAPSPIGMLGTAGQGRAPYPAAPRPGTSEDELNVGKGDSRSPYFRSGLLDIEAVDVAVGDVDGDGRREAVLAGKNRVQAYAIDPASRAWTAACSFEDKRTGIQSLSVDAADLDKDGRDEVFLTLRSAFFQRVESLVLYCENGTFQQKGSLPWMVRAYKSAGKGWSLAAQQLDESAGSTTSSIYGLEYADGRHARSKEALRHKGIRWLYGFALASNADSPMSLSYNHVNRLRLQFKKGAWTTPGKYGQTTSRLKIKEETYYFTPRLIPEGTADSLSGVYTLRNIPRFFALASSFGIYDRAELHFLRFNGLGLESGWKADIGGYAAGLAELPGSGGAADSLVVAVTGAEGRSAVWLFRK
ncbi:MAG: VCBS repeat-containing protein [Elusimicrobiota bacterium]